MSVFKNIDNIKVDLSSSEGIRKWRQWQVYNGLKKLKASLGRKVKIGLYDGTILNDVSGYLENVIVFNISLNDCV